MTLGIALYAFAIAIGVVFSGGIIEISENIHTLNNQNTQPFNNIYWKDCLASSYYPCENNISIKSGDSQSFSISPNIFTTYTLDSKKVYSGQTYEMYVSDQDIGIHEIEVNTIIDKHTWYVSVIK